MRNKKSICPYLSFTLLIRSSTLVWLVTSSCQRSNPTAGRAGAGAAGACHAMPDGCTRRPPLPPRASAAGRRLAARQPSSHLAEQPHLACTCLPGFQRCCWVRSPAQGPAVQVQATGSSVGTWPPLPLRGLHAETVGPSCVAPPCTPVCISPASGTCPPLSCQPAQWRGTGKRSAKGRWELRASHGRHCQRRRQEAARGSGKAKRAPMPCTPASCLDKPVHGAATDPS